MEISIRSILVGSGVILAMPAFCHMTPVYQVEELHLEDLDLVIADQL